VSYKPIFASTKPKAEWLTDMLIYGIFIGLALLLLGKVLNERRLNVRQR